MVPISNIGFATLSIIPSFRGGPQAIAAETTPAMAAAGATGGRAFGTAALAGIAVVVTGAALAGVALFKIGETFDEMSDTIRVGTGATGKALDALNESAKNVGRTVPASFEDIGTAIADLNTRTGQTGPGLEALASQMLEMTRLTGGDLSGNIASVTRVFGDWSIATDDQAATMDYLFKVSQTTGIGIDSLSSKVVQFGAPLRQLGFSFEESAAMLGKWEKEGVNVEAVLAGMKIGLGKMSAAGQEPVEALAAVQAAIEGAGSAGEANAIAIATFGQRAGPDMAAAIREGRFDLDELMATLDASGETILGAAADTEDFGQSWTKFKNTVLIAVEPLATKMFRAISAGMKWFTTTGAPALAAFGATVSEKVMPVLSRLGEFITGTIVPGIASFVGWLRQNEAWLVPIAVGIGAMVVALQTYAVIMAVIRTATAAWAAVQAILNVVLTANPIGLIILAVVAVVAAITAAYFKFEAFRNIIDAVWDGIQVVVGAVVGFFQTYVMPVLQFVFNAVVGYLRFLWSVYEPIWNLIYAVVEKVVGWFMATAWPKIKQFVDLIVIGAQKLWADFQPIWVQIQAIVQKVVTWFTTIAWPAIQTFIAGQVAAWQGAWVVVKGAWDQIYAAVSTVVTWFTETALPAIRSFISGVTGAFTRVVTFVTDIPGKITSTLGNLGSLLYNAGSAIIGGLLQGIVDKFESVKSFVSSIGPWISEHKGPLSYDQRLLVPAGVAIMDGLNAGLRSQMSELARTTGDINTIVGGRGPQIGSLDSASPATRAAAVNGSPGADMTALIASVDALRKEVRDQAERDRTMVRSNGYGR